MTRRVAKPRARKRVYRKEELEVVCPSILKRGLAFAKQKKVVSGLLQHFGHQPNYQLQRDSLDFGKKRRAAPKT